MIGPALTNIVNPKRVTESMEATFWHSDTELLAEHLYIPHNISPAQLVTIASGKHQIVLRLLLELEKVFP